ncbi:MAG TPA: serine/threonine-protein kinase, partial [Planctomycetota bacterium]|nr:serine/threonine-protein kinase [Planctomycetota bacterium]
LKIHTEIHDSEAKDAILQEAKASASLDRCPNIVTIYDAGSHDGVPYIAMEFVEGQTLRDMIDATGGVTGEAFWSLAQGICEGLKFAHEQPMRVIHRDLKPSNIMVTPSGVPKIADFGIAKVIGRMGGEDEAKTLVASAGSSALGTAATMSPEQAENHSVDERSDIYSLGCVLYWMGTGRPPFVGDPISILVQHSTRPPDPPTSINPMLTDKRAERIILKCLEKAPDERYQTAGELLKDINEVIAADRRTRVPWYRSAAALVLAFVAMAIAVYFTRPGSDDNGESSEANLRSRAPHAVDGQAYSEGAHYFVTEAGPKVLLGGSAARSDLTIKVRFEEIEEEHSVAKGSAFATLPLPKSIREGIPYEVLGLEGDDERFRFRATLDKTPPRVLVGTAGRPFVEIPDELRVIDDASIRFRFEDDGVGFDAAGTRRREASLKDLLADGTTSRNALTSAKQLSEDLVEITARDFLGNGQEQRRLRIRKQPLRVVLADAEKIPRYVATRIAFGFSLSAEGFDLSESPLPGDLTLTDSNQWVSEAITFRDGLYAVDVPLPDPGPLGHTQRELSIQYRGRILPIAGDVASIPIFQCTKAPDLILLHQPPGTAERSFRAQDLGREAIEISNSEQITDTLVLRIRHDASAPILPCSVEWDADGTTEALTIGSDGVIRLPKVDLEANAEAKRFLVRARDVAGNATHMEVFLRRGTFEIATQSIGDAALLEGWDGFAFRLQQGGPLPLVARVAGFPDALFVKLTGAKASEATIVKLEESQSSERRATILLPELKENEDLSLSLSSH